MPNKSSHFPQKPNAVGPDPLGIGIGEVLADITESGRAQQCIGARVRDHIGVAVANQPAFTVEHHATENQFAIWVIGERVNVETLSDSYRHPLNLPEGIEQDRSDRQIVRSGDLDIGWFTVNDHDSSANGFDQCCIVGGSGRCRMRISENGSAERLWGLNGNEG